MKLSTQQSKAKDAVLKWFTEYNHITSKPFFYITGFAGTGKTTILKDIIESLGCEVTCCAYTGKASINFNQKTGYACSTIHSLLYKPVEKNGQILDWRLDLKNIKLNTTKLIIIDEVSMVNKEIWEDLLKFKKPILVTGDSYQLPPVSGDLLFTENMADFSLTEIHRQALENPIIRLSKDLREGNDISFGSYDDKVYKIRSNDFDMKDALAFDQVICGLNKTRVKMNTFARKHYGFTQPLPQANEKIICLRNNRNVGVVNGQLFNVVTTATKHQKQVGTFECEIADGSFWHSAKIYDDEFTRDSVRDTRWRLIKKNPEILICDYAYAMTCHKSQGSEFDNVCFFDESDCFRDDKFKFLYTAVTRARENIVIVK